MLSTEVGQAQSSPVIRPCFRLGECEVCRGTDACRSQSSRIAFCSARARAVRRKSFWVLQGHGAGTGLVPMQSVVMVGSENVYYRIDET
jgi:hypothetical protein